MIAAVPRTTVAITPIRRRPAVPRAVDVLTMSLSPRTRFGSFEIVDVIGVGGMGEVYRATDVNLARDVAIKVLPSSFASDPERIARFEREARTLGALNHPNIAHVYGLERAGTLHGLVMELVDGLTLDERIARGRLAGDEAVRIALQIAAALEAAHERGIVHRDLKPANVKIKPDGTVKVLDFGIAKSAAPVSAASTPTEVGITRSGFVAGTLAYMSPEQARGAPVDQRADIWSFACVLYEMLAGRPAFGEGEDAADPDAVAKLPAGVSPRVRQTLRLCLQRAPSRRLADIRDVRLALEGAFDSGILEQRREASVARTIAPWATALVATAVAVASTWAWLRTGVPAAPAPRPPLSLAVDLSNVSVATDFPVATLSPDGNRVVYVATGADGVAHLATRRLDEFGATALPGTDRGYAPFFSPDGEWIGFFADGKLKKTRVAGGTPIVLCEAAAGRGASWGDDGWIVAALDNRSGLARVSANDGAVVPLTALGAGQVSHRWPQVLPGTKAVIFVVSHISGNYAAADIGAARLDGSSPAAVKIVREAAGMAPHYFETGHIAYVANGVLYAQPFDAAALEVRGAPVAVIDGVSSAVGFGSAQLTFSRTGAVLYRGGQTTGRTVLRWLSANGRTEPLWDEAALYQDPRVSPDGLRVVATIADGLSADVWVYDSARGSKTRLTSGGVNRGPLWTPDGRHIVFNSSGRLYVARADGAGRPEPLVAGENPLTASSFTPDGRRFLYFEQLGARAVMYTVAIDEEAGRLRAGPPERVHETSSGMPLPALSPDGRWIAYASAESGLYEVYVRAFPDDGRQWTISTGGGSMPAWSRTANEIFYRTDDQLLMVASYTVEGGAFNATRPRVWSEQRLFNTGLVPNFDLAPDGARFAVMLSAEGPSSLESHPLLLDVNFFDEVRRRVRAD
jgi:serine/threonine-protein kinase